MSRALLFSGFRRIARLPGQFPVVTLSTSTGALQIGGQHCVPFDTPCEEAVCDSRPAAIIRDDAPKEARLRHLDCRATRIVIVASQSWLVGRPRRASHRDGESRCAADVTALHVPHQLGRDGKRHEDISDRDRLAHALTWRCGTPRPRPFQAVRLATRSRAMWPECPPSRRLSERFRVWPPGDTKSIRRSAIVAEQLITVGRLRACSRRCRPVAALQSVLVGMGSLNRRTTQRGAWLASD